MQSQEPLTVTLEPNPLDCWAEESTASALRALAVWLHSAGLSLHQTTAALEPLGITRSHQAVFQWVHRTAEEAPDPPRARVIGATSERPKSASYVLSYRRSQSQRRRVQTLRRPLQPSRVAVDVTAVKIGTEQYWLYAAIDVETKLLLGVWISPRRGTNPAAEFLGRLAEKHDLSDATFLIDGMGYLTALARCRLSGHLNSVERNLIEKWFQTLAMRIDRFHQTWMGRRARARVIGVTFECCSSCKLPLLIPSIPFSSTTYSNLAQTTPALAHRLRPLL